MGSVDEHPEQEYSFISLDGQGGTFVWSPVDSRMDRLDRKQSGLAPCKAVGQVTQWFLLRIMLPSVTSWLVIHQCHISTGYMLCWDRTDQFTECRGLEWRVGEWTTSASKLASKLRSKTVAYIVGRLVGCCHSWLELCSLSHYLGVVSLPDDTKHEYVNIPIKTAMFVFGWSFPYHLSSEVLKLTSCDCPEVGTEKPPVFVEDLYWAHGHAVCTSIQDMCWDPESCVGWTFGAWATWDCRSHDRKISDPLCSFVAFKRSQVPDRLVIPVWFWNMYIHMCVYAYIYIWL